MMKMRKQGKAYLIIARGKKQLAVLIIPLLLSRSREKAPLPLLLMM
jgi:hypothetical protein